MPEVTTGAQFFDEFIDDYFSECDEHLATVRRLLLTLEDTSDYPPEPATLQELSRALHTLKGLSGMVGLSSAEEVAHAMEDCVRVVAQNERAPTLVLESLFAGEALLEASIASRRSGANDPSPGPYVDRVGDVLRMIATPGPRSSPPASSMAIQPVGTNARRFEFIPSAELAARGVGVEMIRQRLASLGQVTATTPRVRPTGGVAFEFIVSVREGSPPPPDTWRSDGLSWNEWTSARPVSSGEVVVHSDRRPAGFTPPTTSNVVRVDLSRLDELMRLVGELVVTRSRLGQAVERASGVHSPAVLDELEQANEMIDRQLRTIREGVMRIRLVPIGEVFERMRFAMRDVARETGKAILIEFSGQDTKIDKVVVDRLLEPLLHLVRNSVGHGIESRAERVAAGKPAEGTIALRAQAAGDRIILRVEDDGAGIDVPLVTRRAIELGLVDSDEPLAPDTLLDVICSPGFSTRESADMSSGRGVGMAVARTTIRGLGGELFVASAAGQGTRFTIELPLTLMITDALILEVGDQTMAIPQTALREILPLDPAAVTRFENNEVLSYRGRVIPLVNLGTIFKLPLRAGAARHVLVVGNDLHLAGLVADRVIGFREIVVHPVPDPLVEVPGIAGATELADGRVSLILDAAAIVRTARDRGRHLMKERAWS